MAENTITARVDTTTAAGFYTVPVGKTAEVLYASITNATANAVEFTFRWQDATASNARYDFFTAVSLPALSKLVPLRDGFTMHAGDQLWCLVGGASGQLDIVLTVNIEP